MIKKIIIVAALLAAGFSHAAAAEGKIKGIMFGDYYYVAAADDAETKFPEKRNAFQLRRLYFTYEKDIASDFTIRYRLEAKDDGFGSAAKMEPYVKHGYLKWKNAVGSSTLYLGLSGTPTWALAEQAWGYRAVEKTLLDLNKIGSSADLGVALHGKASRMNYHLMVGNGNGQSAETDHGKKLYSSLSLASSSALTLEGYADFNMLPGGRDQMTLKVLAAYKGESLRGGVEAFTRINKEAGRAAQIGDDVTISGVSLFAALPVGESSKGFGRVDLVRNDDRDTTDLLIIAGIDREVEKNIHLMPNLYVQLPDGPDANIQARLTASYKF